MIKDIPDIDIDTANRDEVLKHLEGYINATIGENHDARKHNTGVYVTDIPYDPRTGGATIDHKRAEELGYIKLDILNMSVYEKVRDEAHLDSLISREPNWKRLWEDQEFCQSVVHINNHYKSICVMQPDTLPRMAMFLALIRPDKKHLMGKSWKEVADDIWTKTDKYFFKKSHSISYSFLVAIHMNLLEESENES